MLAVLLLDVGFQYWPSLKGKGFAGDLVCIGYSLRWLIVIRFNSLAYKVWVNLDDRTVWRLFVPAI